MLISRTHKRVSKISKMICRLNHFVLSSPVGFQKSINTQNPTSVWLKCQCFCTSSIDYLKVSPRESSVHSPNFSGQKVSRVARTEAQDVLFDYLHCTRGFSFTDAEHISKNSPRFLQNLLSNVGTDGNVAPSLTKFLRYNPINEFEPFFESLGLSPSEVLSLLPRHLMFLCDDHLMFENFRVLCHYGVARSMIGRMYKEAKEIFRYGSGVLALKLEAYENLGLGKPTVIKLVSCCPTLLTGCINRDFVKVLEILRRLEIDGDWFGKYMSCKYSYNWNRMVDTLDFLYKVGYTEEQMQSLFKSNPSLLLEGSGKKVYILFGRLLKLGFKITELYHLFVQNPQILSTKYAKNLLRGVNFLFEIEMGMEDIGYIISSHMQLLGSCSLKGPKSVCKDLNVGEKSLRQIIKDDPMKLFSLASKSKNRINDQVTCQDPTKHLEKTTFLMSLGYAENSDEMSKALKQFRGRGDQLQERFDCLVKAGLDCNVVANIIKQAPMVLNQSKEVIEEKINCLLNRLGCPLDALVAFPAYLCYKIERINNRFSMYVWLREKGAAKPNLSLGSILACSDKRFIKYFVDVHPEGPAMWERIKTKTSQSS